MTQTIPFRNPTPPPARPVPPSQRIARQQAAAPPTEGRHRVPQAPGIPVPKSPVPGRPSQDDDEYGFDAGGPVRAPRFQQGPDLEQFAEATIDQALPQELQPGDVVDVPDDAASEATVYGQVQNPYQGLGEGGYAIDIDPDRLPGRVQGQLSAFTSIDFSRGEEGMDRKSGRYCYWRTPTHREDGEPIPGGGFIVIGPAWPVEVARQYEKGMRRLRRYGEFPLRDLRARWNSLQEPYRLLFARGGAHEFSIEQVIAHKWHVKPPYKGVRFPQLENALATGELAPEDLQAVKCPYPGCGRTFANEEHLKKHEGVMHAERANQNQLARAIAGATSGSSQALAEAVKTIGEGLMQQQAQASGTQELIAMLMQQNQLLLARMGLSPDAAIALGPVLDAQTPPPAPPPAPPVSHQQRQAAPAAKKAAKRTKAKPRTASGRFQRQPVGVGTDAPTA